MHYTVPRHALLHIHALKYLHPNSPHASLHILVLPNTPPLPSLILFLSPSGYARLPLDDPLADYVSSPCSNRPVPLVNSLLKRDHSGLVSTTRSRNWLPGHTLAHLESIRPRHATDLLLPHSISYSTLHPPPGFVHQHNCRLICIIIWFIVTKRLVDALTVSA
jgi:hypothetical protein